MPSVTQNNISDIADTESVNENAAGLYMIDHICAALTDLEHISCVEHHNVLLRDAERNRKLLLCHSVAVLTVDRDRIFRTYQRINEFDLLLACMPGYMGILGNYGRALHGEFVDDSRYGFLISRDRGRT